MRAGIERLRDGGYDTYVVSNGNPEMLDSMVAHADIGDLIEDTVSADEVGTFKPDTELYRHAAAARTGTPWEPFAGDPDLTVEGIHELAAELAV